MHGLLFLVPVVFFVFLSLFYLMISQAHAALPNARPAAMSMIARTATATFFMQDGLNEYLDNSVI